MTLKKALIADVHKHGSTECIRYICPHTRPTSVYVRPQIWADLFHFVLSLIWWLIYFCSARSRRPLLSVVLSTCREKNPLCYWFRMCWIVTLNGGVLPSECFIRIRRLPWIQAAAGYCDPALLCPDCRTNPTLRGILPRHFIYRLPSLQRWKLFLIILFLWEEGGCWCWWRGRPAFMYTDEAAAKQRQRPINATRVLLPIRKAGQVFCLVSRAVVSSLLCWQIPIFTLSAVAVGSEHLLSDVVGGEGGLGLSVSGNTPL